MIAEDVEFQIAQYADGTLPEAEKSQVDSLLKSDADARQMLAEYRKLDGHLAQLRDMPGVRWDRFANHISNAIDDAEPAVAGRIGFAAWSGRMRIAASVLIVVAGGLVARQLLHHDPVATVPPPPSGVIEIDGPVAEAPSGTPSADISVAPSQLAAGDGGARYANTGIGTGPSKVVIRTAIKNDNPDAKTQPH